MMVSAVTTATRSSDSARSDDTAIGVRHPVRKRTARKRRPSSRLLSVGAGAAMSGLSANGPRTAAHAPSTHTHAPAQAPATNPGKRPATSSKCNKCGVQPNASVRLRIAHAKRTGKFVGISQ